MKKSVKTVLLSLLGGAAILALGLILGQSTTANERKVYIPDDNLRSEIVEQVKWNPETGEEEPVENELPTVSQMERLEQLSASNVSSLEGLQFAKNVTSLSYTASTDLYVVDFRPISGMDSLEQFFCYSFEPGRSTPVDITPFGELKNLKTLHLGYYGSVFDFSPLSDLENLERVTAVGYGRVEFPAVYVDRTTKTFNMRHPVTYSTQFDGTCGVEATLWEADEEAGAIGEAQLTLEDQKITISNIEEETTTIQFTFSASSQDGNFDAVTNCVVPIIWE
ncbi:hypothetical protein LI951_06030 [Enterococcus sp. BWT-B8]|uniref:hypothetical protein n=1 Tax=unclassified Enterococcus TaxID=2608891 RepID=UPI001E530F3F|nr:MULTISPECIES: hypothetical protein [unclassified Enterococcus]MCB5951618.1 hypothetical protein [Enterococcus sp. BWT-B8]MCB5954710.1 hypothetical protein [Enterococcus sp. CWB-B31]